MNGPHGWFDRMCGDGAHSAPDTSSSSTSSESAPPLMMSRANVARPVNALSQMCEAVLKLGQFMSIQDAHVLPDQIESVLRMVQNAAHHMPEGRREMRPNSGLPKQIMKTQRGPEWRSLFETFETMPIASASIGQVHAVTLSPSLPFYPNHAHPSSQSPPSPTRLAVKAQFLNIQNSITSDIRTITALLSRTTSLLPKGLFLGKTLDVFKGESGDECDYPREASAVKRNERFRVPKVFGLAEGVDGKDRLTTGKVLTTEWMEESPVEGAVKWEQEVRDESHEAFWYYPSENYSPDFAILDAQLQIMSLLGEPFQPASQLNGNDSRFDFSSNILPTQIRALIPTMLQNRLTPPPRETYSLNRKLSGAFYFVDG
ncbi:hypothetical protein FRB98_008801 [Tulasnella sp. 332]|nr:hypothetical protein FRB98_008801 [Tulasnella sp. 332]